MTKPVIYHNPRCSKSRQTLSLIHERGIEVNVVEYLKEPPSEARLAGLIQMLGIRPIDLIRKKEELFRTLGLAGKHHDDKALIAAMVEHPILIERPIVVYGRKAVIGRPPQKVLELMNWG